MNKQAAQLLEQHFDTAFAAPDGIAKLRELILTLAMQGKLVEQDPNDPPASELLKEIEAERKRGSHEGTKNTGQNREIIMWYKKIGICPLEVNSYFYFNLKFFYS